MGLFFLWEKLWDKIWDNFLFAISCDSFNKNLLINSCGLIYVIYQHLPYYISVNFKNQLNINCSELIIN